VYFKGRPYRFGIGERCSLGEALAYKCRVKTEYRKTTEIITRLTNAQKSQRKRVEDAVNKAIGIVNEMGEAFEYDKFLELFKGKKPKGNKDLFEYWKDYVKYLKKNNRHGTAISYDSVRTKFIKFICFTEDIQYEKDMEISFPFDKLTVDFFESFEQWVVSTSKRPKEKALVSVGIYCRTIRAVINKAMEERIMPKKQLFGNKGYVIPGAGDDLAIGLPKEELERIFNFEAIGERRFYLAMFELMYRLNGSYPAEITFLRWDHERNGCFVFPRRKTLLTAKKNRKSTEIKITPRIREIMDLYGNPKNKYIFDIINDDMTEEQQRLKQSDLTGGINRTLKYVCNRLGMAPCSTKYARHGFASLLAQNGYGVRDIADLIKNSSLEATSRYVSSLQQDRADKVAELLG
jgi:integrase